MTRSVTSAVSNTSAECRSHGVFVPPQASGLLPALVHALRGDEESLRRWDQRARPLLWRALRRAGCSAVATDEAITSLLEQALRTARSGATIRNEPAWMSAVLASALRDRRRAATRAMAAYRRLAEHSPRWDDPEPKGELREELGAAARSLGPRFSLAIRLRLRGLDAHEAQAALSVSLGIGRKQARRLDRCSLDLMRAALAAREARTAREERNRNPCPDRRVSGLYLPGRTDPRGGPVSRVPAPELEERKRAVHDPLDSDAERAPAPVLSRTP